MPRAEYAERRVWTGWADAGAGGRQGWRGRAGSQTYDPRPAIPPKICDPRPTTPCDPGLVRVTAGRRVARAIRTPCTVHHAQTMCGKSVFMMGQHALLAVSITT